MCGCILDPILEGIVIFFIQSGVWVLAILANGIKIVLDSLKVKS